MLLTHREEDVAVVHEHHEQAADAGEVVEVREDHEHDGDDMVRQHLVMVLTTCFGVKNEYLMQVARRLDQVV